MGRFKPAPGLIGYDFGTKPAFSVALGVQVIGVIPQQEGDDEPPPVFCHDLYGDTLDYAVSGVSICSACYTVRLSDGSHVDVKVTFTLTPTGTVTWSGTFWQNLFVGTATFTFYTTSDRSCGGDATDVDTDCSMTVFCGESEGKSLFIAFIRAAAGFGVNTLSMTIFSNVEGAFIGDPMTNDLAAGDCGDDPLAIDGTMNGGYGGVVTITPVP